jgi:hypothetical protein
VPDDADQFSTDAQIKRRRMPKKFLMYPQNGQKIPENAQGPEKMPKIAGIVQPELLICLLCRK